MLSKDSQCTGRLKMILEIRITDNYSGAQHIDHNILEFNYLD